MINPTVIGKTSICQFLCNPNESQSIVLIRMLQTLIFAVYSTVLPGPVTKSDCH